MSAATTWPRVRTVAPGARRHLHLVPTGATAAPPGLRLTRRGRAVGVACAAVVVVALAVLMAAHASAAPGRAERRVTVDPGTTLSEVAVREMPGVPVAQAVADLQRVNGLHSGEINAGRVLVVPGR